jgi:hypothetical protein
LARPKTKVRPRLRGGVNGNQTGARKSTARQTGRRGLGATRAAPRRVAVVFRDPAYFSGAALP